MTVEQWLGEGNTLGTDIWNKKYRQNGESFDQWLDRVSGGNDDVREIIKEKKFLFGGRILANRGMNKLGRKITYSNCFSGDTEIATKNGIFKLSDLVGKDVEVFSFGKWRKATVKCFGEQETVTLVLQKGKTSRTYRVTEDHLWYVKNNSRKFSMTKTSDLAHGDIIPTSVSRCYRAYKPSPFGVAHGAFWGDGDHTGKNRRMSFCGDKIELIPYFTPDTISCSTGTSVINGIPKIFQNPPSMEEAPSYLYGFLAGYFATDGSIDCRGQCVFTSSVKENIVLVQNILTILGIPFTDMYFQDRISNLTGEVGRIYYQRVNAKYLNESFFILSRHKNRFRGNNYSGFEWKVKDVVYDRKIEPVYCVVEPEKNAFTLKGGILTHNCYVISPPEDNIESIFECASKLARTYSTGGGCGIDIGKLSPKGAKINNAATETSGAVSFMDLYSMVTGLIGQGGRRAALMISIPCNHPDLLDFIHVKDDLNRVTKANISVRVTRDFMEAVKNNRPFDLSFIREETGEEIKKNVNARSVFMELAKGNWRMGEPGILFWDRIESYNLLSETPGFKYAGVNPCLVGDTLIQTTEGEIPIKELVGRTPHVYCMDECGNLAIGMATKVWKTRTNAQIVLVKTKRGQIKCTPDHLIHTRNRGWVSAQDLKRGDKITGLNRQMKDETHVSVGLSGGRYVPEHRFIARAFGDIDGKDVHHKDGDTLNNKYSNLEVLSHSEHSKITNTNRKIDAIRGEDGRYIKKETKAKRCSFNLGCGVGTNWVVESVSWLEKKEDVYDMTVENFHNFVANRMIVHNCAEEPLPAGGSCLLGSLNLDSFVDKKTKQFNFDEFRKSVRIATLALNDVLDEGLPLHPLEEQRKSVSEWRQIGLGFMGLADACIHMEIEYGSKESLILFHQIGRDLINEAMIESSLIAKEKGTFEHYSYENISKTEFYQNVADPTTDAYVHKYGLRNSQLLTCAPTGTLSTMLGISGGLEPIFANYYTRKTESLHGKDKVYKVYTKIVKEYMDEHNISDDSELPPYFVTAQTLNYKDRIQVQSVWQKYIDASISSTVNVPQEFTVEKVFDLYMEAYNAGLKGVTIFRDGCERAGILTTHTEENKEDVQKYDYIKPVSRKSLGVTHGDTYCKKCACGTLYITVNRDDNGNMVECFVHTSKGGICQANISAVNRMISLSMRSGVKIDEIIDQLKAINCPACSNVRAKGKQIDGLSCPDIISRVLQSAYDKKKSQDTKTPVVQNAQKKPEKQEENCENESICPECGSPVRFEGGCVTCAECGWSRCG